MNVLQGKKIHEVCLVTDFVANGSFASLRENVQYINTPDYAILVRLTDFTKGWNNKYVYVSEASYNFLKKSSLKPGDLLMSNVGEPGKVFVVPDLKKPMTLGPNSILIRPNIKELNPIYLYYYFLSPKGKDQIESISSATTQKKFNKTSFRNLVIPIPALEEQEKIIKMLDQAYELRQKRKQAIYLLDNYSQSVFIDMFGDPISNPKNWPRKKLGEITNISSGGTPNREHDEYYGGDIPWVKTTEVNGHLILKTQEFITEVGLKNSSCHIYPKDSIIIAMYGQGKTRGQVGVLGIEATTNQACGVLYPNKSYNTIYIFKLLQYSYDNLRNLGRGGNQPNLNAGILKNYQVIFPPIDLQTKFSKVVEEVEKVKQKMLIQSQELETQFQALMQKNFI